MKESERKRPNAQRAVSRNPQLQAKPPPRYRQAADIFGFVTKKIKFYIWKYYKIK